MTVELGATTSPDFVATLSKAAAFRDRRSDRPSAKEVVNALLQAEKAAKQQRLTYPLESLLGDWGRSSEAVTRGKIAWKVIRPM